MESNLYFEQQHQDQKQIQRRARNLGPGGGRDERLNGGLRSIRD